jgi:hypothetical protein
MTHAGHNTQGTEEVNPSTVSPYRSPSRACPSASPGPVVYRNLALPVSVFDHIKDTQRALEAAKGAKPSISQTVSHIVHEHRMNVEREGRNHEQDHNRVQALCR